MKNFDQWGEKKKRLDASIHKPPYVKAGHIWWAYVGENVGSEISGKSELFSRPVFIYKKLSRGTYLVLPSSTKQKEGSWYVHITQGGKDMYLCLHQARIIDYRRLSTQLGEVDEQDLARIKGSFLRLYSEKCSTPALRRGWSWEIPKSKPIVSLVFFLQAIRRGSMEIEKIPQKVRDKIQRTSGGQK